MYIANYHRRLQAVFLIFLLQFTIVFARLFYIHLFRGQYLSNLAKKQHSLYIELEPRRGTIYDTNFRPQAVNLACDSVYAVPRKLTANEKQKVIEALKEVLNLKHSFLEQRLSKDKAFVWIARKISNEQSQLLRKMNLKGIGFIKESKRCYPNSYLASQVIGFADIDNKGLEGIELSFDHYLRGQPGWVLSLRDARHNKLDLYSRMVEPVDGADLVLTIDEVIQYIAESSLDKVYRNSSAKGATIIVMEPFSGAILAMANRPTFDLNHPQQASKDQIRNRAICDMFEPGSVFKIVTACAAMEEKKVEEQTKFFCENGEYRVANHTLHDHRPHGWLTFREVIEQSSNIGTCKVAQMLGTSTLYRYIKLFGFGSRTGIELPGEVAGKIRDIRNWSKTSIAAVPMGQEVGVTALQLAVAMSVIANGGTLLKPYIVRQIRDSKGKVIESFGPQVINPQVIASETCARIRNILIGVVENGTGKLAKMDEYTAAGKTGTAQKLEPNGTYSHNKFIASFIGFAPAENPEVVIVVVVDEPRGNYYGGTVAAPVFKEVASATIRYLRAQQKNTLVALP
ncbi:MAG: penicillin-binding protein 2 [Candidatus Omnitrophica bacterium]|nr:penicillin-binding protein 2 [Candidatus Omnitrophota bacterium]